MVIIRQPVRKLQFWDALLQENIDQVREMLSESADLFLAEEPCPDAPFRSFPLIWACRRGNADLAYTLIHVGRARVNLKDSRRYTALLWAIILNRSSIVQILADSGSNVDDADPYGMSLVMIAIKRCSIDILEIMIKANKCIVHKKCSLTGLTPLQFAVLHDNVDAAQLLLKCGAHAHGNVFGADPLMFLAESPAMVSLLVRFGVNVDERNRIGDTPLLSGIKRCNRCCNHIGESRCSIKYPECSWGQPDQERLIPSFE